MRRSVVLMGHDVQRDPGERRSTTEAGLSLPLAELLELLEAVRARGWRFAGFREFMERRHREPLALLTFDDGYRTLHDDLLPELALRRIPALVFLISGAYQLGRENLGLQLFALRDRRGSLAPEALAALEELPGIRAVRDRAGAGSLPELLAWSEARVAAAFQAALDPAAAEALEKDLAGLGVLPRTTLAPEEIARMRASGCFDFGAHSVRHRSFQRLSRREVQREIVDSRDFLASMLGRAPAELPFAYPYGGVTPAARRCVRRHCAAGFTTRERAISRLDSDDLLPRLELGADLPARLDALRPGADLADLLAERTRLRLQPLARWLRRLRPARPA